MEAAEREAGAAAVLRVLRHRRRHVEHRVEAHGPAGVLADRVLEHARGDDLRLVAAARRRASARSAGRSRSRTSRRCPRARGTARRSSAGRSAAPGRSSNSAPYCVSAVDARACAPSSTPISPRMFSAASELKKRTPIDRRVADRARTVAALYQTSRPARRARAGPETRRSSPRAAARPAGSLTCGRRGMTRKSAVVAQRVGERLDDVDVDDVRDVDRLLARRRC